MKYVVRMNVTEVHLAYVTAKDEQEATLKAQQMLAFGDTYYKHSFVETTVEKDTEVQREED